MSAADMDDGGPAFPRPYSSDAVGNQDLSQPGMSLRDWLAGQALAILADSTYQGDPQQTASVSYKIADAMLAARKAGR